MDKEQLTGLETPPAPSTDAPPFEPEPEKKRGRPPGSKTRPKTQDQVKVELRSVEAAWQGIWLLLRFGGRLLGFECDSPMLPDEEAQADAKSLQAVVQRHPRAMQVLAWIGAPVVMVQRIAQHFSKKKIEKAKKNSQPHEAPSAQSVG